MERVLILGASLLQLPAILKAKEKGYRVAVVDYDTNAVGIRFADEYYNCSTIDIERITDIAGKIRPKGILTIASDMPMRAVAAVCGEYGLTGISWETAIKTTDKAEMIKAFEYYDVGHPWYYVVCSLDEMRTVVKTISYPCVIKPTDNSGSRGVTFANSEQELLEGYEYAKKESRCGSVIIEEYLEGPEVSVEVMVVDGVVHVVQITDKMTTGAPHFVEIGHSQPTNQPEETIVKIKDIAQKAIRAVGITSGPAHLEMIITVDGPKMVEIGARLGGDCITSHLVPMSTGIDMVGATIDVACGRKPDLFQAFTKGAAIRYIDAAEGMLKSVEGIDEAKKIKGVQEVSIVKELGSLIPQMKSSTSRIGFVISQAETSEEAVDICEKAMRLISINVEPI